MDRQAGPGHCRGHPGRNGNPAGHTESLRGRPQATGDLRGVLHGVLRQLLPGIVHLQRRSYANAKASPAENCLSARSSAAAAGHGLFFHPSEGLICNLASSGAQCALLFFCSHPQMRSMQNHSK